MPAFQVLYPSARLFKTLDVAPDGFGYLFHVTRPDGHEVAFVVRRACSTAWRCKSSTRPDGGKG